MVGLRDKRIPKYFAVMGILLTIGIVWLLAGPVAMWDSVLVWLLLVFNLLLGGYNIYILLSPETAVKCAEEGIYLFGLKKTSFYSYQEVKYASHKERNIRYARSDNAWIFYHRQNNDIGTLYIAVDSGNGEEIISLHGIMQVSFVAHWITDEVKKRKEKVEE